MTLIWGAGGSTSWLNGTPRATPRAHKVSTLGLPVPDSSWESVDFAMPARRASSVSESPTRSRSRRSEAAMAASGAGLTAGDPAPPVLVSYVMFAPLDYLVGLTNSARSVHHIGREFDMANKPSRAARQPHALALLVRSTGSRPDSRHRGHRLGGRLRRHLLRRDRHRFRCPCLGCDRLLGD